MHFHHDRFSASGPEWVSIDDSEKNKLRNIVKILEKKFSGIIGNVVKVDKVKGIEINSSNFLVHGSTNALVVKLIDIDDYSHFEYQIHIYDQIKNLRLPGPRILGSDNGELMGKPFIAMKYIPGQYFSGSKTDLFLAGDAIQKLHKGFSNYNESSFSELPILQVNSNQILFKFLEDRIKWNSKFDSNLLSIIKNNIELLIETERKCSAELSMLMNERKSIFHIDLHPHNIIVGNNKATVIDIDLLKKIAWPSALGFCFFKLSRQAIAFQGSKKIDYDNLKDFFEIIVSRYGTSDDMVRLCFLGGLTEILRRILIILEGNIGSKISPWNQVLEIQIKAISEIYFIYKKVFEYYDM